MTKFPFSLIILATAGSVAEARCYEDNCYRGKHQPLARRHHHS